MSTTTTQPNLYLTRMRPLRVINIYRSCTTGAKVIAALMNKHLYSPHDVLHVRRVPELETRGVFWNPHVRPRAPCFQQERITVVPEEHSAVSELVDGCDLADKAVLHETSEAVWLLNQNLHGKEQQDCRHYQRPSGSISLLRRVRSELLATMTTNIILFGGRCDLILNTSEGSSTFMITVLFWAVTERVVVIPNRIFGITHWFHLQG